MSAFDNGERRKSHELRPASFDQIRKLVRISEILHREISPLLSLITNLGRKDLAGLARIKCENPFLLSDLPSLWEVFFLDKKGIAYTQTKKTKNILKESRIMIIITVEDILNIARTRTSYQQNLGLVLLKLQALVGADDIKVVMTDSRVLEKFAYFARDLSLKDLEIGKKYAGGILQVYMDFFEDEWLLWVDELSTKIPLQLLIIEKENEQDKTEDLKCPAFLKRVQERIRFHLKDKISFFKDIMNCGWAYKRECDWYELIVLVNESRKIPQDHAQRTKVYSSWQCCLLRVWIKLFGMEETRKEADRIFERTDFWETGAQETKDGELLHIAVEVGSVKGVKMTAYLGLIYWRDRNSRTALELAGETLGNDHKVTKYLQDEIDMLTLSGYFAEAI